MKAYELPLKVTTEGTIKLPESLLNELPSDQLVRVIILVPEPLAAEEETAWSSLTSEQFLSGYDEADSIYDRA